MALVVNDRVKETSTTTGTGTLTLDGAVTGFETFSSAIGNTNTTYYAIELPNTAEFEVGLGTVSAGQLARTTVISSSNSDALVNFSAGTKNVFCTLPASKAVIEDASNNVTLPGDLTVDTNTLYVDSSNNRVGIGITSPSERLHIFGGDILFQGATPILKFQPTADSQQNKIDFALAAGTVQSSITGGGVDGQSLKFDTASNTRMTINSSGNVGIGTTSPTYTLESLGSGTDGALAVFHNQGSGGVYSGVQIASDNQLGGGNSDTNLIMTRWNGVGTKVAAVKLGVVQNNNDGVLTFSTAENADLGSSTYTERMRIDGDTGNIGIGTTSPSTLLHLSSSDPQITITDTDGTGSQVIKADGDNLVLDSPSNIKFDADSAGNVWFMDGGTTFLKVYKFGGTKIEANVADEDLIFKVNDGGSFIDVLTFDSSEAGAATFNDKVILGASKRLELGDPGEYIFGDGTNLTAASSGYINLSSTGNLLLNTSTSSSVFFRQNDVNHLQILKTGDNPIIKSSISDGDLIIKGNDGGSEITALTFDMSEAGDATFNSNIFLGDNKKANFGAGNDLQIYHDGTQSIIEDAGTGQLKILAENTLYIGSATGTEKYIRALKNGMVELSYDNSAKLTTTSTGIDVTGTAVTDGLTVAGNVSVDSGTIKLDGNYPTGTDNVALGDTALDDGSLSGASNTAIGSKSLTANTTGASNTAVGLATLFTNTTGSNNVAIGINSLKLHTTSNTTAVGASAMAANTTGSENTAVGYLALTTNSTGSQNTAIGREALEKYTAGGATAVGFQALEENTTGVSNTAVGYLSFSSMTTGARNVGIGYAVGQNSNTSNSTYVGYRTGLNASGVQNTFIGYESGTQAGGQLNTYVGTSAGGSGSGDNNVAVGRSAGTVISGDDNVLVGESSGGIVSGNNNIIIGANSAPSASNANNEITLGDANITSLRIPGLASGASSGDVLTYDGTDITLSAPTGVSAGFSIAMAIAL